MQPVNSLPVSTRTIFLLDRNVVALIKDAAVDGKQRDAKKQAYLDKAVAQQSPVPVRVRFLTLDEGLFGILDHIGIVRPQLTATGGLAMQIRYSSALFPALSAADAVALLRRHVRTEP